MFLILSQIILYILEFVSLKKSTIKVFMVFSIWKSISFLNNEEKILDKVVFRWVDEIVATRKTLRY